MATPPCRDDVPPPSEPAPTRIRAVLVSSSPNLTVRPLDAAEEPLYSLHQMSAWLWSITPSRPGNYFLVLTLSLAGWSRDGIAISIRKFVVLIVVVEKKRSAVRAMLKVTRGGADWLAETLGLLGVGAILLERFLPARKTAAAAGGHVPGDPPGGSAA